jgi:hypothetical protein
MRDPNMFVFAGKSRTSVALLASVFVMCVVSLSAIETRAETEVTGSSRLGTIAGVVRDHAGSPIADATVAIFRLGTSRLLKEVRSAKDGSYLVRILPGKYTVLAVAEGFNPVTLSEVEINRASLLNYGFKLERSGSGNTLPEKRLDRDNPKWVIRSAQVSRSIYQNNEGTSATDVELTESAPELENGRDRNTALKGQTVVETYVASSENGSYAGVNFAALMPLAENTDLILAGQGGIGKDAPQRFETHIRYRPNLDHQIRLRAGLGTLGTVRMDDSVRQLGMVSVQATDEWRVREGIILVYGFDYSKFVGAGGDFSLSPRIGFQYDLDSKTRLRTAFTTQTEDRTWSRAIELEDAQVLFREPFAVEDIAIEGGKPVMNRSSRLEFGVERVLDNRSSIEANAFVDTTFARGIGLTSFPVAFSGVDSSELVGNQQGNAQGIRFVYARRISGQISTSAGYSFGNGQRLSASGISNPAELFDNDFFHSFFGQINADLNTGTSVKTVFRLSPQATVFAIDPFRGRLAIYDPSLSILVTQNLPNLGLPINAEAVFDARNLFDFQTGVAGDDGVLRLNSHRRSIRGGILVRF